VADRVEFIQGDLFGAAIHAATVVTLFLAGNAGSQLPRRTRVLDRR